MKPRLLDARKLFVLANALMGILAVLVTAGLIHALAVSQPLPPPPTRAAVREAAAAGDGVSRATLDDEGFESFRVIVDKPLFNPSRSEAKPAVPVAPAAPLPPLPTLHGVVLDGERARAYLEERETARVLSYRVGDAVAGGVIEAIAKDRVSIRRAGVALRIMLIHPAGGPKPAPGSAARSGSTRGRMPGFDGQGRGGAAPQSNRLRGSSAGATPGRP